jgi:pyruvate-ferredoxin/flavodoxin oxidoreductase
VLNDTNALFSGDPLTGLIDGGAVFMQSPYTSPADVWQRIPEHQKRSIRQRKIRIFFADMVKIAREVASEADLEMRMQGIVLLGAFLKLTPYAKDSGMSDEEVYAASKRRSASTSASAVTASSRTTSTASNADTAKCKRFHRL